MYSAPKYVGTQTVTLSSRFSFEDCIFAFKSDLKFTELAPLTFTKKE